MRIGWRGRGERGDAAALAAAAPPPSGGATGGLTAAPAASAAGGRRRRGYLELTGSTAISLVLVLPLLALYQVGVMVVDFEVVSGVDFVTRYVFSFHGLRGIVLLNLVVVFAFLAAIIRLEHQGRFRPTLFWPLLVESALYAWLLATVLGFCLARLHDYGIDGAVAARIASVGRGVPSLGVAGGLAGLADSRVLRAAVLSIGAGVYEEIVFRLLLIAVLEYVFLDLIELKRPTAVAFAVVLSSLLFAWAHHLGPFGEPFDPGVFAFRAAAGLLFAALYKLRSLAVAVYAHAIYDLYVLVL